MSRVFVVDPMCAQERGHNLAMLKKFGERIAELTESTTVIVASRDLPDHLAVGIERYFSYLYSDVLPIEGVDLDPVDEPERIYSGLVAGFMHPKEQRSITDWEGLFLDLDIGAGDTIVIPGVDFFGLAGLFGYLRTIEDGQWPKLALRFLAVMEFAARGFDNPLGLLAQAIAAFSQQGGELTISSETPAFSAELSLATGFPTLVVPYPMSNDLSSPVNVNGPPLINFAGSSRLDKGFLKIFDILANLSVARPKLETRMVVQELGAREAAANEEATAQLYAFPGLELLPATIGLETMERIQNETTVFVAPYSKRTYRLRGSAILMEAAAIGRPIVGSAGCGFSSQINYFGLGGTARTPREFALEILRLLEMDPVDRFQRVRQGRYRLETESEWAFEKWLTP